MPSPKIICGLAVSLDGYIAAPDGAVDWLNPYSTREVMALMTEFMATIGLMFMGRTTFDHALRLGVGNPAAGPPRAIVLTKRPITGVPDPTSVQTMSGSAKAVAKRLRADAAGLKGKKKDIWCMGGGRVLADFLAAGEIDAIDIGVMPIALGAGIPLFPPGFPRTALKLVRCKPYSNGVIRLKYTVKRPAKSR